MIVQVEALNLLPFYTDQFDAAERASMTIGERSETFGLGNAVLAAMGLKNIEDRLVGSAADGDEVGIAG